MARLEVQRSLAADHPAFAGHFPGRPVLPGVVLLSEVLLAIQASPVMAAAIGPEPVLLAAKFLAPVTGGCTLQIVLQLTAGALAFEVGVDDRPVAKGQYQARVPEGGPAHGAAP